MEIKKIGNKGIGTLKTDVIRFTHAGVDYTIVTGDDTAGFRVRRYDGQYINISPVVRNEIIVR